MEIIDQAREVAKRHEAARTYLASYGLTDVDQTALSRQGFVSRELRGLNSITYKLRYRLDGQQRVRYIGTDSCDAERVKQAVTELQTGRRTELAMRRLNREAARLLRDGKRRLEGPLAAAGFRFHGFAVRRRRAGGGDV